ncbi:IclR family transcriptional regulator [Nocardiopsis sediminis]|uniref:IclR family transcriptional regulator n=1 Tax=Nocardiopsis sediminis TaxID=1778267 RepID=A0ABV8FIN2_9ACTN
MNAADPAEGTLEPRRNASISLRRALAILEYVRARPAGDGEVTLSLLADAVGVNKSSVLRLAAPLLESGLLVRDRRTGRFRLGPAALALGQAYLDQLDLRSVAARHLRDLVRCTGHACHLGVLEGRDAVVVVAAGTAATVRTPAGLRVPAHRSAAGKAILAFGPPDLVDDVLGAGLAAATAKTITDPEALRAELRRVRRRGYAVEDRENDPGVRCVAAPVFDHDREPVAAVGAAAPPRGLPVARVRELGPRVAAVAARITADLGTRPGAHS